MIHAQNTPVVVIAHRGWPRRFPDNTLAGVLAASSVADMVEVDVRRSGDGKLVLSHDPLIQGHVVAEQRWSFLGGLDLGEGHRPALLDEALAALPDFPVLIEVKNEPFAPGYEPDHRVALEVAERCRPGDVVSSFNWASMRRVRDLYPEAATGLAVGAPDAWGEAIEECHQAGHETLIPDHRFLDEGQLERAGGLEVYTWTVNDPARARELALLGASGIITDTPDLIKQAL
jgi:glycerophosphoryl diester phosphodiesterase